jgi:uncharacterized protein (DUF983 family)
MTETLNFVAAPAIVEASRGTGQAIKRGLMGRCPNCGEGRMFRAYLKVVDKCPACGEELFHQRADDAPAYLTMLIVGHFIVSGIVATEAWWPDSPLLPLALGWSALTASASLWLLPRVKGALVGYQWAFRMHGFGGPEKEFG